MKRTLSLIGLVAIIMTIAIFGNACGKPKPCKGTMTVYDTTGVFPQAGVLVKLYSTVTTPSGGTATADLKWQGTTDASGIVSVTFKLPAIMDIRAERIGCVPKPSTKTYCIGTGIIKLEEGKTIEKKVRLTM